MEFLNKAEQDLFSDWGKRELPGWKAEPPIRPCHRLAADQEGPLYTRLAAAGMGRLHRIKQVYLERAAARGTVPDFTEPLDAGGLFAVRHKADRDRLIYDRRPRNSRERQFGWSRLPAGCQWAQTVIPKDCVLRGSADDLSNYFYTLRQTPRG